MRILVADDNQSVRRGVLNLLASAPHFEVCGEAADGAEALARAAELRPDLVLLDVSMPGIGGLEVTRLLRQRVPGTKILIMSQHDPEMLLPHAKAAGAQGCVDKNQLSTQLLPSIERVANSLQN